MDLATTKSLLDGWARGDLARPHERRKAGVLLEASDLAGQRLAEAITQSSRGARPVAGAGVIQSQELPPI